MAVKKTLTFDTTLENQAALDKYINTFKERHPNTKKLKKPEVLGKFYEEVIMPQLISMTKTMQSEIDNYKNTAK